MGTQAGTVREAGLRLRPDQEGAAAWAQRYPTGEARTIKAAPFAPIDGYFFLSTLRPPPPIMVTNMS